MSNTARKLIDEMVDAIRESIGEVPVEEIPMPWKHQWGTVVAIEYPEDRPLVVDVVFRDGLKFAETKGAKYTMGPDGVWDYPPDWFDKK